MALSSRKLSTSVAVLVDTQSSTWWRWILEAASSSLTFSIFAVWLHLLASFSLIFTGIVLLMQLSTEFWMIPLPLISASLEASFVEGIFLLFFFVRNVVVLRSRLE